ncbi:hypothetical protein Tco_0610795 [Tanacetum coccineum]
MPLTLRGDGPVSKNGSSSGRREDKVKFHQGRVSSLLGQEVIILLYKKIIFHVRKMEKRRLFEHKGVEGLATFLYPLLEEDDELRETAGVDIGQNPERKI